jgi:hypothetical protein
MGALALAEHLVSLGEPVPADVSVRFRDGSAVVNLMLLSGGAAEIATYQDRFGGTIRERLHSGPTLLTELVGVVFDGQFRVWVLTPLSEREFAARFLDEHGSYEDWAPATRRQYEAGIDSIRARVDW